MALRRDDDSAYQKLMDQCMALKTEILKLHNALKACGDAGLIQSDELQRCHCQLAQADLRIRLLQGKEPT